MRKFISVLAIITLLLLPSVLANNSDNSNRPTEPLDKIQFIHYKDGTVKQIGGPATSPTCYKLLGVKWKSLPQSYVINPGIYSLSFVTSAISASANEWDSHTSTTLYSGYTVDYSATWDDSPSNVDYKNEYVFGSYPDSGVIAVTNVWYTRFSRQIVDYDVLFNTASYTFADCSSGGCSSAMDLQEIATHETGHGLGLADIYSTSCSYVTMYGYASYGETLKRDLAGPDITGLQKMYGA